MVFIPFHTRPHSAKTKAPIPAGSLRLTFVRHLPPGGRYHSPPPPYGCTFLRFGATDDRWSPLRSLLGFDCRGVHCTSAVPNHGEAVDVLRRRRISHFRISENISRLRKQTSLPFPPHAPKAHIACRRQISHGSAVYRIFASAKIYRVCKANTYPPTRVSRKQEKNGVFTPFFLLFPLLYSSSAKKARISFLVAGILPLMSSFEPPQRAKSCSIISTETPRMVGAGPAM